MAVTVTIVAGKSISITTPDGNTSTTGLRPTTVIDIAARARPASIPEGYTPVPGWPRYIVTVRNSDREVPLAIQMGDTDQGTWVNTLAGAQIARAAIAAALP